jgi:hypothetical protein
MKTSILPLPAFLPQYLRSTLRLTISVDALLNSTPTSSPPHQSGHLHRQRRVPTVLSAASNIRRSRLPPSAQTCAHPKEHQVPPEPNPSSPDPRVRARSPALVLLPPTLLQVPHVTHPCSLYHLPSHQHSTLCHMAPTLRQSTVWDHYLKTEGGRKPDPAYLVGAGFRSFRRKRWSSQSPQQKTVKKPYRASYLRNSVRMIKRCC